MEGSSCWGRAVGREGRPSPLERERSGRAQSCAHSGSLGLRVWPREVKTEMVMPLLLGPGGQWRPVPMGLRVVRPQEAGHSPALAYRGLG